MALIDSVVHAFFPTRRIGARWLREQLIAYGVKVRLSPGCTDEFVLSAHAAAVQDGSSGEPYSARLRRQIEARAQFIQLWTSSDEKLERSSWIAWVELARKHSIPRAWKLSEPAQVTAPTRPESFRVPAQLIVKSADRPSSRSPSDETAELPGDQVLADLKRSPGALTPTSDELPEAENANQQRDWSKSS